MNKNKLIKGITLNDIYDFVDNGDPDDTPEGIALYFVLMDKVRSLDQRAADYGTKESILKHLIKAEGLTRHIAEKVYYDGLEYYYASAQLTKQAQRNVYAAKIDRQIAIIEPFVSDAKDAKILVDMIKTAASIRQLDKEEQEIIPEEWMKEQFVMYTTNALEAGLEPINRIALGKQIDAYPEITTKEISQLRREANIDTLIIFPDEQENPRKDRQ
ncbi:MAG: hypothetical protein ACSHXA_07535 [Polaribacter sp.]|uniref:hypothetical protein n=1 Tax=Polaribacter sp. TaxID=1920175 RepID=UPI003EF22A97